MKRISTKEINRGGGTKEHRYMESKNVMSMEYIYITYAVMEDVYQCKICDNKEISTRRKVISKKCG